MPIVKVEKNTYTADQLYQWDLDQVLEIRGLSLASIPEVHFANDAMDRAIVRQATMDAAGVIHVRIPNSLLQKPYRIIAYVCVYEEGAFRSRYKIELKVKARQQPADYKLVDDPEVYSFEAMENEIANLRRDYAQWEKDADDRLADANSAAASAASAATSSANSAAKAETAAGDAHRVAQEVSDRLDEQEQDIQDAVDHVRILANSIGERKELVRFTESGTFRPADYPSLDDLYIIVLQGAGGSGYVNQGGGAGGYAVVKTVLSEEAYTVTIGAGGAGRYVGGNYDNIYSGYRGGSTAFGPFVVPGGLGGESDAEPVTVGAFQAEVGTSEKGGDSFFGVGGARVAANTGNGNPGGIGAGGGACPVPYSGRSYYSGAGGDGLVIVYGYVAK